MVTARTAPFTHPVTLDWRKHQVGDRRRCRICGQGAFMRDETGEPCHKVCAEIEAAKTATDTNQRYRRGA